MVPKSGTAHPAAYVSLVPKLGMYLCCMYFYGLLVPYNVQRSCQLPAACLKSQVSSRERRRWCDEKPFKFPWRAILKVSQKRTERTSPVQQCHSYETVAFSVTIVGVAQRTDPLTATSWKRNWNPFLNQESMHAFFGWSIDLTIARQQTVGRGNERVIIAFALLVIKYFSDGRNNF
jgi:hypothetical protein